MKTARAFLVIAALPVVALAILALLGARDDVGVVMTGRGSLLGAAWVACWLCTMTLTPIAAGAALVPFALSKVLIVLGRARGTSPLTKQDSS